MRLWERRIAALCLLAALIWVYAAAVVLIRLGCIDSSVSKCGNVTEPEVYRSVWNDFWRQWEFG